MSVGGLSCLQLGVLLVELLVLVAESSELSSLGAKQGQHTTQAAFLQHARALQAECVHHCLQKSLPLLGFAF